jgi:2-keto-4-pentenoate hydratase/2-oxohepta-3-ene-1,7-dioic acid hydratase in catechol pathway
MRRGLLIAADSIEVNHAEVRMPVMRLVTFDDGSGPHPGALDPGGIRDLSAFVPSVDEIVSRGRGFLADLVSSVAAAPLFDPGGVRLLPPIRPASLRDFLAFEKHARRGAERRGEKLADAWYEIPIYYKGNHREITGPDADVVWPSFSEKLDYEMEIAAVLGVRGRDLTGRAAEDAIIGYTIMNDWSARDVQRLEMAARLGPAKSKDFATSLGPALVTWDEIDPRHGLVMIARVNDEVWSRGTSADMHWTFPQMVAHVSRGEDVWPGDVYGSGTSYGCCGLDLDRWIQPGDVVELEIEGLGILRNRIIKERDKREGRRSTSSSLYP